MKKITLLSLIFCTSMMGQIIYTDVDPDLFFVGNITHSIDIDNDGTNDIELVGTTTSLHTQGINGAEILGFADEAYRFTVGIPLSNVNAIFYSSSILMTDQPTGNGNWESPSLNYYIGFRLFIGSNYRYGWLRMNVIHSAAPNFVSWSPLDFAYNSSGSTIETGETDPLSNDSFELSEVKLISNNKELKVLNLEEDAKYKIYSINGQKVKEGIAKKHSHTIKLKSLNSGIYVVKLEGTETGKSRIMKILF